MTLRGLRRYIAIDIALVAAGHLLFAVGDLLIWLSRL